MEFLLEVDLCQFCEALIDIEHWKGTSCHICCEILDAEGLQAVRSKLWAPPVQDAEWVNPYNKQIPPMGPVGRLHMYEKLAKPGGTTSHPHIILSSAPSYPVYTAAEQDLGMHNWPLVAEFAGNQYGGLVNMPKYNIFRGNPSG